MNIPFEKLPFHVQNQIIRQRVIDLCYADEMYREMCDLQRSSEEHRAHVRHIPTTRIVEQKY